MMQSGGNWANTWLGTANADAVRIAATTELMTIDTFFCIIVKNGLQGNGFILLFVSQNSSMLYLRCFTSGAKNIVESLDIFKL